MHVSFNNTRLAFSNLVFPSKLKAACALETPVKDVLAASKSDLVEGIYNFYLSYCCSCQYQKRNILTLILRLETLLPLLFN